MSALLLAVSGCSLLFSASDPASRDGGQDPVIDGGATLDAFTGVLAPVSYLEIGQGRAFATFAEWHEERKGNLTSRQLLAVEVASSFANSDTLTGAPSGCEGTLQANAANNPVDGNLLTIDLKDGATPCKIGDTLTGSAAGGSAIVTAASVVGVCETATFYDSNVTGPIVLDGFDTSAEAHVTLRANPENPHEGTQGTGIKISAGNVPSSAFHNVVIKTDHTHLLGFEISWTSADSGMARRSVVDIQASGVLLDRLLIHGDPSHAKSDGIHIGQVGVTGTVHVVVRNSFIFNVGRAGIHMKDAVGGQLEVLSCSLANCMQALSVFGAANFACVSVAGGTSGNTLKLVNTIAVANVNGKPEFIVTGNGNAFHESSSHNAAPQPDFGNGDAGIIATSAVASDFVGCCDEGINLHLNSALESQGIPLDFTLDIDGDIRTEPWPIGADQP